jgi:hypothetical protein
VLTAVTNLVAYTQFPPVPHGRPPHLHCSWRTAAARTLAGLRESTSPKCRFAATRLSCVYTSPDGAVEVYGVVDGEVIRGSGVLELRSAQAGEGSGRAWMTMCQCVNVSMLPGVLCSAFVGKRVFRH